MFNILKLSATLSRNECIQHAALLYKYSLLYDFQSQLTWGISVNKDNIIKYDGSVQPSHKIAAKIVSKLIPKVVITIT